MSKEFFLYFYRHKPVIILTCLLILGCSLQYLILSGDNINAVKDALSVNSEVLIFQNFAMDTISFLSLIYYIYCSSSSIINDKKNGVLIYSFVKNISTVKVLLNKLIAAYAFVLTSNLFLVLSISVVSLFIYGGDSEMIANAFSLLIMKTYTAVFYVNLAVLFAILVNNYVFVLSILFIVEIAKVGLYSLLKDLFISRFIILNHLDISYFFNLPSTGVDRGYSLLFTLSMYVIYMAIILMLSYFIFDRKRGKLI